MLATHLIVCAYDGTSTWRTLVIGWNTVTDGCSLRLDLNAVL